MSEGGREGKKGYVMSLVFEAYERQFCEVSANLYSKCPAADGELKKQSMSEMNAELEEAETLIKKMDLEARTLEPDVRTTLLAKIKAHASDLKNLKNQVKKIASNQAHRTAREELLELRMGDKLEVSADQRGRLLMAQSSTDRLNSSTDRIRESRKQTVEAEELGASILQDLHRQRQSLLHAHGTVCGLIKTNMCHGVANLSLEMAAAPLTC
uniref:Vesicle transport v-SNARE N-terminal domain-containing protein n=2 Tax=Kalanchoe fedtschenkoi TaxID=63787 RepID=A0A7N0ZVG9_KALFE